MLFESIRVARILEFVWDTSEALLSGRLLYIIYVIHLTFALSDILNIYFLSCGDSDFMHPNKMLVSRDNINCLLF